jgi:rubrerythrin
MMSLLNVNDLVQFAVRIEENGERFYRAWAKRVSDPVQAAFFTKLADDEVKHKEIYATMLGRIGPSEPDMETYEEYMAYLRMFTEGVLFNEEKNSREMAAVNSVGDALDFAAKQELDSILFYLELKTFVPKAQEETINEVVKEERRHYIALLNARKELNA